ncbi:nitrite reductase [Nocardioides sp. Root122]|uniref:nitrite reductase n=1 Tax=Nocardioides TaxID=1839 RepID=UPI0007025739|nr:MULTISPECIES: nitrite reductase [Nocardioides]KQV77579.1 nitrite reductase [Nocardioides sp. Root122]MCK9822015.1 nitrite reductase [Nocardioides cavernae]
MTERTRADLCPGVFRPWPADDGALVRLRIPGGHLTRTKLAALLDVAEAYGDGEVHLTKRANLQLRALPLSGDDVPTEVVEAIRATGLLPHPDHELVRNILVSPLTGLHGGRADLRPVTAELDERICATPSLAKLPGRFLLVLDDGRGDLIDRSCDLGLVALDAETVQLRVGSTHWGPVVPLHEAAARLAGLARAFQQVRETAWHVDELPVPPASSDADPHLPTASPPPPYGDMAEGITHLEVPGGVLDRAAIGDLSEHLVVTPWKSLIAY